MSTDEASQQVGEPRITVDDPDDYNLSRRYQQIHRAQEYVLQIRREAGREASRGEMSLGRFREELAQAVCDFAMELEWIAKDIDEDDDRQSDERQRIREVHDRIWDEADIEAPRHPDGEINGIGDFVDRYGLISVEETFEYESPFRGSAGKGTEQTLDSPSVETTMRIYRLCRGFMKAIGLEVKFDSGLPRDML